MTYPSPHPGPPQGQGGSPNSPYAPYAAYGQQPANAPYSGAVYGQMPTPAGQVSYTHSEQLAIPTQSVRHSPRAAAIPGQPYPPAQAPAPQYLAGPTAIPQYQPYQQGYESSGAAYLSGAVTAPGYSAGGQIPALGHPGTQTTSPQSIGIGNYVPWRGEKAAALIMMLVACALEFVIYITFVLTLKTNSGWVDVLFITAMFLAVTPAIWAHYFGLRHLVRNQPVSEMVGLSLWFGVGTLTATSGTQNSSYSGLQSICITLLFIVSTVCSILNARINQRLKTPQLWTTTLALGACQFILLNNVFRLAELTLVAGTSIAHGKSISQYTSNAWLIWSDSEGAGISLAPGLLVTVAITSLAAASLFLGMRSPRSKAFFITSMSAGCLLTLHNLLVVAVYGLPKSGEHAYTPSDAPVEVLTVIIVGAALIGAPLLAACRGAATARSTSGPHGSYVSSSLGTPGTQSRFRQYRR